MCFQDVLSIPIDGTTQPGSATSIYEQVLRALLEVLLQYAGGGHLKCVSWHVASFVLCNFKGNTLCRNIFLQMISYIYIIDTRASHVFSSCISCFRCPVFLISTVPGMPLTIGHVYDDPSHGFCWRHLAVLYSHVLTWMNFVFTRIQRIRTTA